jgi:hypothetical protein
MTKADTPAEKGYSGKIPTAVIIAFEHELAGLEHGTASLVVHIRDGKLVRFTSGRDVSHVAEEGDGK